MDVTGRQTVAKALARTHGGDRDGWERVAEYQRVLEWRGKHPNRGSSAAASALDLPRGRIRPWIDDSARPDPVRTVQRAEDHGWLDLEWGIEPFTGLNVLVAWIFSGGSIARNFVPRFAIGDDADEADLATAFEAIGLDYRRRDREPGRAIEIEPAEAGTTLGRLLAALGAPQGVKNRTSSLALPAYLDVAPFETRLAFARTYVRNRAVRRPDRTRQPVQVKEDRSATFRRALSSFLCDVVGHPEAVTGSEVLYLSQRQRRCCMTLDDDLPENRAVYGPA